MNEEWRPVQIAQFKDIYEVSNLGRVRCTPRLVAIRKCSGYDCVSLRHKGSNTSIPVHRLIAAAFIRPPAKGEVVNHKNADRSDNRIENLEWTTPAGNCAHTAKLGRTTRYPEHHESKIDPAVAFDMRRNGHSYSEIGATFGASTAAAWALIQRAIKRGEFKP